MLFSSSKPKCYSTAAKQMAGQHGLSYRDPLEELSEKFHTSEDLLRTLNPTADFDRAGTTIAVPDVQPLEFRHGAHTIEAARPKSGETEGESVTTIVVDKPARDVRAYGKDGNGQNNYVTTLPLSAPCAANEVTVVMEAQPGLESFLDAKAWLRRKSSAAMSYFESSRATETF
jgi:hypothetical protein